ncbi:MAG: BlaI/MecI/CopY family transcriptional regulator [Eubacteriales bacterium]|nr:BlaI/MecI/CopY family transcriptional regulator [Clostridiales bacterium]MDY3285702.1 BlaI/MecI/CopY family transcriptional regulator [Eubacteriales bacterium]
MPVALSAGEWTLMDALWAHPGATLAELTRTLGERAGWKKNTVLVMLERLEKKGAVRVVQGERARRYEPAATRESCAAEESRRFLDRVYDGSVGLFVSAMASENALTPGDLDALRRIVREAEEKAADGEEKRDV